MAVSSASTNYRSLVSVFQEIGRSIDVAGEKGQLVSANEAEKVIDKINALEPKARAEATEALKQLAADGFIDISDEGREKFAKAFNIAPRALTARETAQRAGLEQQRSIFQGYMQTLTKVPQLDKKYMGNIIQGLEQAAPKEMQQMMAAIVLDMSKDGLVKLDTHARKAQAKWIGKLDQDGGVSQWSETINKPQSPEMTAFQAALARGGFFEDILAAFMFMIVGQIQDETTEKMQELDRATDRRKENAKRADNKSGEMANLMRETLGKEGASHEYTRGQIQETQRDLEAVVATADDALKDGIIGPGEALRIRKKLERIDAPVDKMMAVALHNALRRSGLDLENGSIGAIVSWVKEKLGEEIDLSPLPAANSSNPDDPVLNELSGSGKLQDRLAGFLIDAFQASSNSTLGDKVKAMNKLVEEIAEHPECKEVLGKLERGEISKDQASAELATHDHAHSDELMQQVHGHDDHAPEAAARSAAPEAAHAPEAPAEAAATASAPNAAKAGEQPKGRQVVMEELKQLQQELTQVLQAVSNILNMLHQNAMNSARSIR